MLNLVMIAGLFAVGVLTRSLGVVAAGGDYVADSAALALGIWAVRVRDRVGEHSRAPTYVAGVNGVVLLVVSTVVAAAGADRLAHGTPTIHGLPVLLVSALTTVVMVVGALVLGVGSRREDLHMRSVLLDTLADALAAAAVAVSGAIIYATGRWFWLDSLVSVVIAVLIAAGAVRLLSQVASALRHGAAFDPDDD